MARATSGPVIVVSGPDSLPRLEAQLHSLGRSCERVTSIGYEPVEVDRLRKRLDGIGGTTTTLVLTSQEAVTAFLRPFLREFRGCEIVVAGPSTADRVRRLGCPVVRIGQPYGAGGVARALQRGPPRRIVYARSNRAGPQLGRRLRLLGHEVLDLVAYRVVSRPVGVETRNRFGRPFTAVITSPSAMSELRRGLSARDFERFRRFAKPVALGPRTARALRGHGLRGVRTCGAGGLPNLRAPDLTQPLLRVLSAEA